MKNNNSKSYLSVAIVVIIGALIALAGSQGSTKVEGYPLYAFAVIVAFADTLFKSDFKIDSSKDGIIWVNRVDDPSAFASG